MNIGVPAPDGYRLPRIESERLVLVPFTRSEAEAVLSGGRRSTWSAGYPTEGDLEIARMVVRSPVDPTPQPGFGPFTILERDSGMAIGGAGFMGPPDPEGAIELGYGVAPEWRGHGLATEAVVGLLEFAWSQPEVKKVLAATDLTNAASARVLEKAGLRRVRSDRDLIYFEMTKPS